MKKLLLCICPLLIALAAAACPACEAQQPRFLRGIIHGAGPESRWDYLIVSIMMAIVAVTFLLSMKWLLKPGEKAAHHIKRLIINSHTDA